MTLWSSFVNRIPAWRTVFKLKLLHAAITFTRMQPGKRLNGEIKFWLNWIRIKSNRDWPLLLFDQSHSWSTLRIKNSGTYSERNFPTCHFLPRRRKRSNWRECLLTELPTIPYFYWRIGDSIKKIITSLCSFDYVAKKTEPSSLGEEEEINLLIPESSENDSEVAKPKKQKKPPMVNESSASESISEVDNRKENVLEDDHCDTKIENYISLNYAYLNFFSPWKAQSISPMFILVPQVLSVL